MITEAGPAIGGIIALYICGIPEVSHFGKTHPILNDEKIQKNSKFSSEMFIFYSSPKLHDYIKI